jgi:hypothetical protein
MNPSIRLPVRVLVIILTLVLAMGTVGAVWGLAARGLSPALAAGAAPVVTVGPASAAAGATITITGSGFPVGAGIIQISINGQVVGEAAPPDFTRDVVLPQGLEPGLTSVTVCVTGACGTGGAGEVESPLRVLPHLSQVPADVMRRTLDFFAITQPFVPEWTEAKLDDVAFPYFRPDINGPAYFEFALHDAAGKPAGFIVASTGEHDYPIAHWSTSGPSLAAGLLNAAGGQALNLYKLSPLTYGAETPDLQRLVRAEGEENPMLKVSGLKGTNLASLDTRFEWTPEDGFSQTGLITTPVGLSVSEWASWQDLKQNYAGNYEPILKVRREHAAEEWATVRRREEVGISLAPGETYTMPLIDDPHYTISGSVASLIEVEPIPDALRISAIAAEEGQGVPFDVILRYDDGREETVRFFVIDYERHSLQLPLVMGGAPAARLRTEPAMPAGTAGETILGWHFAYADGGFAGQRLYNQIKPFTWPNVTSCHSGCGAAAWAMLLGFGDNQADVWPLNPTWLNKFGLYTQSGGVNTPDVAAPLTNDPGVNNMQMEIRREIGTFCLGGSGATWPWSMGGVYRYPERRNWAWVHVFGGYNFINNEAPHIANSIVLERTPAIMLTGSLDTLHYPLAYGYAYARVRDCGWNLFTGYRCEERLRYPYFKINPGWGPYSPSLGSWTPASTGYHGEAFPCYYAWQGWNLVRVCP